MGSCVSPSCYMKWISLLLLLGNGQSAHICQYRTLRDCEQDNDGLCISAKGEEVVLGGRKFTPGPRPCKNEDRYSYSLLGDRLCHETPQAVSERDCPSYSFESCVYLGDTAYWAKDNKAYEVRSCSPNVIFPGFDTIEYTITLPSLEKEFQIRGDKLYTCNKLDIRIDGNDLYGRADVVGYTVYKDKSCKIVGGQRAVSNLNRAGSFVAFEVTVETEDGNYYAFQAPTSRSCVMAFWKGEERVFMKNQSENEVGIFSSSSCSSASLSKKVKVDYVEDDKFIIARIGNSSTSTSRRSSSNQPDRVDIVGGFYPYQGCRQLGETGSVWVPFANAKISDVLVFGDNDIACGVHKGHMGTIEVISSLSRDSTIRNSISGLKFEAKEECVTFKDHDYSRTFDQRGRLFIYEWDSHDRGCTMLRDAIEIEQVASEMTRVAGVTSYTLPGLVGSSSDGSSDTETRRRNSIPTTIAQREEINEDGMNENDIIYQDSTNNSSNDNEEQMVEAPSIRLSSDGLSSGVFDIPAFPEDEAFDGCGRIEVLYDERNKMFRQLGCTTNECAIPDSQPSTGGGGLCTALGPYSEGFWRIFDEQEKLGRSDGACGGHGAGDGGVCWRDGEVIV